MAGKNFRNLHWILKFRLRNSEFCSKQVNVQKDLSMYSRIAFRRVHCRPKLDTSHFDRSESLQMPS